MARVLTGIGRIGGTKEGFLISGVYGPNVPGEREGFIKNV